MTNRTLFAKSATSGLLAIALTLGSTGIASAHSGGANAVLTTSEQAEILNDVDMTQEELDTATKEVELLFSVYLSQSEHGDWYVTSKGQAVDASQEDLAKIVSAMNGQIPKNDTDKWAGRSRVNVSPYVKCVINASGLGAFGGLFTGAFETLIQKKLWQKAAVYIIKLVGKNAIKGGAVGLAAFLAASSVWCLTPWAK